MLDFRQQDAQAVLAGEAYGSLFDAAGLSPFQHPLWLIPFYATLAPHRGAQPVWISIFDGDALVGAVPLIIRKKSGLNLLESTDLGVSDYAAPVLSELCLAKLQADESSAKRFLAALPSHDVLRVRPVREDHAMLWHCLLGFEPQPLGFGAHAVALEPPFEDWRAANLDRSFASQARRKGKRWRKQHDVSLDRLENRDAIKNAIVRLADLRSGRFEGDPIQEEPVVRFYAQVAAAGAAEHLTETWEVSSDGASVGILFGLTHRGRFHYLLIGVDYDGYGRHSPGLQMYEGIIEDWMGRGGTSFDFTIGDEPFKKSYGCVETPMVGFLRTGSLKGRLATLVMGKRLMGTTGEVA
ncbi:MAG: GNAT family N-acetyltransferase [Pseudomonadota bacterium]